MRGKPRLERFMRHPERGLEEAFAYRPAPGAWEISYSEDGEERFERYRSFAELQAAGWHDDPTVYPCCGIRGGCGGPCAAFPCYELVM